jgi:hypothetical protein
MIDEVLLSRITGNKRFRYRKMALIWLIQWGGVTRPLHSCVEE